MGRPPRFGHQRYQATFVTGGDIPFIEVEKIFEYPGGLLLVAWLLLTL
jgi:hypothetical protein